MGDPGSGLRPGGMWTAPERSGGERGESRAAKILENKGESMLEKEAPCDRLPLNWSFRNAIGLKPVAPHRIKQIFQMVIKLIRIFRNGVDLAATLTPKGYAPSGPAYFKRVAADPASEFIFHGGFHFLISHTHNSIPLT